MPKTPLAALMFGITLGTLIVLWICTVQLCRRMKERNRRN